MAQRDYYLVQWQSPAENEEGKYLAKFEERLPTEISNHRDAAVYVREHYPSSRLRQNMTLVYVVITDPEITVIRLDE